METGYLSSMVSTFSCARTKRRVLCVTGGDLESNEKKKVSKGRTSGEVQTCLSQLKKKGLQGQGKGLCAVKHERGSNKIVSQK